LFDEDLGHLWKGEGWLLPTPACFQWRGALKLPHGKSAPRVVCLKNLKYRGERTNIYRKFFDKVRSMKITLPETNSSPRAPKRKFMFQAPICRGKLLVLGSVKICLNP